MTALVFIGVVIIKNRNEKHELAITVKKILMIGFSIVLFHIAILFAENKALCIFANSAYFVAADWILYYLLHFSLEYIGNRFEDHVNKKYMVILLGLDSLSILANNIFGHLYDVQQATFLGEAYWKLQTKPSFFLHYAIILMLVTFCLISLYYGAVHAPLFYRRKYFLIALLLSIIVVVNVACFWLIIDISVFGYVAEGICIYYCTFVYTPQQLMGKTLYLVAQDMSMAVFVFDIEGKLLYSNRMAKELLSTENQLVDKEGISLEQWCRTKYLEGRTGQPEEKSYYCGEEKRVLNIQLKRLKDSKRHHQGGYFIINDRTEELKKLERQKFMATHDSLTGIYNKEYFCEKAEKYIKEHPEKKLILICTDIKNFKMINDFLGDRIGDTVLKNYARMLESKSEGAIVYGRIGNDNFGILMEMENFVESAFTEDVNDVLFEGVERKVAFPIINHLGIYEITDDKTPVSVMCDRARMAIEAIKNDYHKRVSHYNTALRDNIMHEQELISDLSDAMEQGQIQMYLQPQMSAEGKLLGAEALVRWVHPEKGLIMPGDFVPVFEKNGLISDVDMYMWEIACKQLRKWKDEGREELYISVNISPRDFYFMDIYEVFTDLTDKYGVDTQNLKLEITETAIVMDLKRQLELISRLRKKGFVVEMDDFGSGYSSLNMLKDIHVDVLKIDMAFLRKANDEERSKKILQMIISLSKQLEMPVITEGVETAEQIEFLTEMGCDMFQGYYFAKPMSVEQFEQLYF